MSRRSTISISMPQWIHVVVFTVVFETGVVAAMTIVAGVV